jgi:hypothetical protein
MKNACGITAFFAVCAGLFPVVAATVVIQQNGTTWQLLKDDQPYYVMGAGGGAYPEKLVAAGAYCFRLSANGRTLTKKIMVQ